MLETLPHLINSDFPPIARGTLETLQVNLGYQCNQTCLHCHVAAGPNRTEIMGRSTIESVIRFIEAQRIRKLDLTGGAPELNPDFRYLVVAARELGVQVFDRCNLTVLNEPGYEDLAELLAMQQVNIIASLPCYIAENVDQQRGEGTYSESIAVLKKLNALGYGMAGSSLKLDLVYNPSGASLPPPQAQLEADYKRELAERYGIVFNGLLTITNMPIARFGSTLLSKGEFNNYVRLLKSAHRPENLTQVMCRNLLSIDWQGYAYDCDFNQMLDMPFGPDSRVRVHINQLMEAKLQGEEIRVADHCYGCTAGQGSSCQGSLSTT